MPVAEILIIDDDTKICLLLSKLTKRLGHTSRAVHTVGDGLKSCRSEYCDLVLLDLELPDGNGLSILPELVKSPWSPEVIIITGTGNIQGAEIAFEYGAWDFIPKPLNPDEVKLSITRAVQYHNEKQAVQKPMLFSREGIVGESSALKACLELVAQAANTETAILITGETGAGKELIARAIHNNSTRMKDRFVVVDCASLPASLIESALFGYEKGAFTGAVTSRSGMIKQADNGTLFLDEVGELPLTMQKTFLRVLQERCFRPVGAETDVQSDFRLVAATNRDLGAMVDTGEFRKDLLYRLRSIEINVPSLRERRTDIISLVMKHLEKRNLSTDTELKGCSPEFIQVLQTYDWPGNVRELLNALDHALVSAGNTSVLHPVHLPLQIRLPHLKDQLTDDDTDLCSSSESLLQNETLPLIREYRDAMLETAEKAYLVELMRRTRGRIKAACRMSGLSESRLHALLKKYNTPRFRKTK
jgi:DNA-binding NtrC family response regulator